MPNAYVTYEWRNDKNILNNIAKGIDARTDTAVRANAQELVDYIRNHWSASSPSSPGNYPAVVTALLDQSFIITNVSAGLTSGYEVSNSAMNDLGKRYAMFLEFGTIKMSARPFLAPSMQALLPNFRTRMKAVLYQEIDAGY